MTAEIIPTPAETQIRPRRGGRPPAAQAGEVDRRILDAATSLFLRLGFDATSCDQVVIQAGAGKASLYARYANKEELFAAVVRHSVDRTLVPSGDIPWHLPLHERLRAVGHGLLFHALRPEVVALMRVVVTTAHRMPELARLTDRIGREGGVRCVAEAIVGRDDFTPDTFEQAMPVAAKFIDLVFVPHQMRALIGDDPAVLETDAPRRVAEAISLLSGAGWLVPWA